jgi:zinc-ribbon domain
VGTRAVGPCRHGPRDHTADTRAQRRAASTCFDRRANLSLPHGNSGPVRPQPGFPNDHHAARTAPCYVGIRGRSNGAKTQRLGALVTFATHLGECRYDGQTEVLRDRDFGPYRVARRTAQIRVVTATVPATRRSTAVSVVGRPNSVATPTRSASPTRHESAAGEPHFCAHCGAEHHPTEHFCPNCGKHIELPAAALGTGLIS